MNKTIKILHNFIFIISILYFPVIVIFFLFWLSWSDPKNFFIMITWYIIVITVCILSFFKQKMFPFVIIWIIIFFIWLKLDKDFWAKENDKLCKDLRNNKTCIESACWFNCSDFDWAWFITSWIVCKDKDMSLCKIK